MSLSPNDVLTTKQVCEILNISPVTLWRERKAGRISFRRVASKIRFLREDIESYLARNKQAARNS